MAVEIGTATDHVDLFNKLYNFLTGNTDLVNANQAWERVTTVGQAPPFSASTGTTGEGDPNDTTGTVMLKGPGNAQQDEIYVSMRLYENTNLNRQMVFLKGHNGVLPGNPSYDNHVNSSPRKGFAVWGQNTAYWFIANGRRFMGVVKLGTVYEVFYCGLYLPYAYPEGNPYPMAIGGTTHRDTSDVGQETTGPVHRAFVDPEVTSGVSPNDLSSFTALTYAGNWVEFKHSNVNSYRGHCVHPFGSVQPRDLNESRGTITPPDLDWRDLTACYMASQMPLLGGGYLLTPLTLVGSQYESPQVPDPGVSGILDGVTHVAGVGNVAENVVQVSGVDHLVVHNVYRTDNGAYFAMALE